MYVLDSDHVSLHQRQNPAVIQHLRTVPPKEVFVSVVTVEEQCRGWLSLIRRAQTPERLIAAYASLHHAVDYFARINVLDYDDAAAKHFATLRARRIRIGTRDLRIAAIALAANATLVSRNYQDFQQIPDLSLEDWSGSESPA